MAYVQPSLFNPAGFPMMNINCRQAAQNQDIQMVGSVNNVGLWNGRSIDGATRWPQHQQQNGPQISDLHGTTVFTNGRKRSRENIECEEMKKAKTADSNHAVGYDHVFMNQMHVGTYGAPDVFQQHQQPQYGLATHNPTSCFPSSFMEHQSLMYAEKHYDGSLLAALVAEAHGC